MPRTYLGGHTGLRAGQLHQLEASALILRAGRAAGLIVRTEHQVSVRNSVDDPVSGEIDVCWFCPHTRRLLAAWEIDGHDAGESHILGNPKKGTAGIKAKLEACTAPIKVQLLYSLKNNLSAKGPSKRKQIEQWLAGIPVVTDEELMDPTHGDNIETWMERARALVTPAGR